MKKTSKEWLQAIEVTRSGEGKDSWCTASCPICGESRDVTILSSESIAKAAVRGKVLSHIQTNHADLVDDAAAA
jgi:hypothetical protein